MLVDEYQDTNAVQYELLKALVGERSAPFTAVGDDDQSIYGWRGATIDNLKRLPQDYPKLKVIPLEQNYRSTGAILRAANHVIAAQPEAVREEAVERARRRRAGARGRVRRRGARGRARGGVDPGSRARRAAAQVEVRATSRCSTAPTTRRACSSRSCARAQIPYKVSGGQSFFDRAEIKDLCAWLRLLVNQDDDPAFLRAVDHAQARHRPPDAGHARRVRGDAGRRACSRRCSPSSLGTALRREGASARCTSSAAS